MKSLIVVGRHLINDSKKSVIVLWYHTKIVQSLMMLFLLFHVVSNPVILD